MSVTAEKASAWFADRAKNTTMPGARAMFEIAATALREKAEREDPKPLTIEELRQMDGVPVYLVFLSLNETGWEIFVEHDDDGFETDAGSWYYAKTYGKKWFAYRHKPREVDK